MADEMDIDISIDLDPLGDGQPFQSGIDQPNLTIAQTQGSGHTPLDPGQTTQGDVTTHKIHIRGLDDLTTNDITEYVAEHYSSHTPSRIEWIDDTSANIVFDSPAIALEALERLDFHGLNEFSAQDLQLRPAKPYSKSSGANLQIRLALTTDQKRPRAHEASRFYMMHPEYDPREQRRKEKSKSNDHNNGYRRLRYGQDEQRRRRRKDQDEGFDATMYDDSAQASAARSKASSNRRRSMQSSLSSDDAVSPRDRRPKRGGDYFRPRDRGRSASPDKDDGRDTRRRSPLADYSRHSNGNSGKELFPSKPAPNTALTAGSAQELFPHKKLAANLKKELFPTKNHAIHHRRSDAIDAADATADLFAHRLAFTKTQDAIGSASETSLFNGRLKPNSHSESSGVDESATDDLSIRGASRQNQKFSIGGFTTDGTPVGAVRELFPDKAGTNAGKELFAEKLQGRGGKRNRAADMFY
ncbi:MAG: hypothetical protein Q9191_005847 [Dirinaria sp. TL-2023a]